MLLPMGTHAGMKKKRTAPRAASVIASVPTSDNDGAAIRLQRRAAMIDARRVRVGELKVRMKSLRAIRQILADEGCINDETGEPWSIDTLGDDVLYMRGQWKAEAQKSIDIVMQEEIAKLDALEDEAWVAWERSKQKKITTTARTSSVDSPTATTVTADKSTSVREGDGDPRFMAVILDCQKRRAAMRGMDAPTKIEQLNRQDGEVKIKHDLSGLSDAEIEAGLALSKKIHGIGSTEKAASSPAKESASGDAIAS